MNSDGVMQSNQMALRTPKKESRGEVEGEGEKTIARELLGGLGGDLLTLPAMLAGGATLPPEMIQQLWFQTQAVRPPQAFQQNTSANWSPGRASSSGPPGGEIQRGPGPAVVTFMPPPPPPPKGGNTIVKEEHHDQEQDEGGWADARMDYYETMAENEYGVATANTTKPKTFPPPPPPPPKERQEAAGTMWPWGQDSRRADMFGTGGQMGKVAEATVKKEERPEHTETQRCAVATWHHGQHSQRQGGPGVAAGSSGKEVAEGKESIIEELIRRVQEAADFIEDHASEISLPEATESLTQVVRAITEKLAGGAAKPPAPPHGAVTTQEVKLKPHYSESEAALAAKHIEEFKKKVEEAFSVAVAGAVGAAPQTTIEFERPAETVNEVAHRLEAFHGPAGPKVSVQHVAEEGGGIWRKPAASAWFVEKGGDQRKAVFRMNVPARSGYRKASRASVQLKVGDRTVTVQTVKQNLLEYATQWVVAFGPAFRADVGAQSGVAGVTAFLQAGRGQAK